jgi:hypothetical protein
MRLKFVAKFFVGEICIGNHGVGINALNYTALYFTVMPSRSADLGKVGKRGTSVPFVMMLDEVR